MEAFLWKILYECLFKIVICLFFSRTHTRVSLHSRRHPHMPFELSALIGNYHAAVFKHFHTKPKSRPFTWPILPSLTNQKWPLKWAAVLYLIGQFLNSWHLTLQKYLVLSSPPLAAGFMLTVWHRTISSQNCLMSDHSYCWSDILSIQAVDSATRLVWPHPVY